MVEVLDGDLAGDGCSFGVLLGVTRLGTQPGGTNAVVSPKLDREELIWKLGLAFVDNSLPIVVCSLSSFSPHSCMGREMMGGEIFLSIILFWYAWPGIKSF